VKHKFAIFLEATTCCIIYSQILAPTLEEMSFTVDEGDSSVQVCMHFGGEGLNVTATLTTSGTATSRLEWYFGIISCNCRFCRFL